MNHLIAETLPAESGLTNSDPVTGQAAWYDLRVNVTAAEAGDEKSLPQLKGGQQVSDDTVSVLRYAVGAQVNLKRSFRDIITRGWR